MVFLAIFVPSISYGYGTITGNVSNQIFWQALSGVMVEALCSNIVVKATTTDTSGNYSLANLSAEVYSIRASISGYTIRFFPSPVRISENTTYSNINISLVTIGQGMIVFDSNLDGNREIYAVNATSTGQITSSAARLTYNLYDDYEPCTSIDGQKIAFVSSRDGNQEIYLMNADGSKQTRLTYNQTPDIDPCLSPDGKKIAFTSRRSGNDDIFIMDSDGSNQTNLTQNPAQDFEPCLSVDGKKMVFTSNRDGNVVFQ